MIRRQVFLNNALSATCRQATMNDQRVTMIHVVSTSGLCDIPQLKSGKTEGRIRMSDYEIVDTNAENIDGCGFCGYKAGRSEGHRRKSEWLKERYAEGLRFKVLHSRKSGDIGMIEYALGQHTWRPVEAEDYLVIHCLMVNGKHKGKGLGSLLLDSCLRDAKKSKCRGVVVVTSSDSFMAGSGLFLKAGFVSVDRIGPYELLVKKFKKATPDPRFIVERERLLKRHKKGLTILAADQCPYVSKSVERIAEASRTLGLEPKVVRVESAKASRERTIVKCCG
jgi:L-amino acid N-acyltransferase YncA